MDGFVTRRDLITAERLKALSRREDAPSWARLGAHLFALGFSGALARAGLGSWWMAPALAVHGVILIFLFAPLHESIHRTVFRSRALNGALAWVSGLVLVLPPGYFRWFHFAHHRHTQDTKLDPELAGPKPATLGAYVLYVSGWGYWREAVLVLARHARGRVPEPFIPGAAHRAVVVEARVCCAVYGAVAVLALAWASWAPVLYWLVPAVLGQPALRLFLLAEHMDCPLVPDMLANTRTTRSNALVRGLTWNMPFHAEHHAFPGVPFHALPALHRDLAGRHGVLDTGYIALHRRFVGAMRAAARAVAVVLGLLVAAGHGATAEPIVVGGLQFSDEEGGFTLIAVGGSGTVEDPFVVVEEITEMRPAALVIRGLTPEWGNRIPTNHPAGFAIRKVIVNRTDIAWDSYDHELQIVRGVPSDIYDGLSFGQGSNVARPFRSDRFARNITHDEPRDFVNFHDGLVEPGESVTFEFVITATSPLAQFYIVQDPNRPIAALVTPRPIAALETPRRVRRT